MQSPVGAGKLLPATGSEQYESVPGLQDGLHGVGCSLSGPGVHLPISAGQPTSDWCCHCVHELPL